MFKFSQGDIVKRVTKSCKLNSWSVIIEWWIYKVSTVHNDYVTLEWIIWNISSDSLILYEMQIWDYVRRINNDYEDVIVWCIYKISEIHPRDIKIEWSWWTYSKDYFKPVLTTDKELSSTVNGIHSASISDIKACDYLWTWNSDSSVIVDDTQPITVPFDNTQSITVPFNSNPIILMSKTFNDYAVEAFMSNEKNRIAAINARNVLLNLIENLDLAVVAINKVKWVINNDFRKLNSAMEDSNITVISALVAENPQVKEYVERFMENTVAQLVPEPVVSSTSIQDKFK